MGGKNFGWLAVWVPSPDWLRRMRRYQVLRRSHRKFGGGELRAVPRLCIEYHGICLTTEENHGKPVREAEWRSA